MGTSSNGNCKDSLIEKTRAFWSKRYGRELSSEEAREISERLYEFVSILTWWDKQDKLKKTFLNQLRLVLKSRMK